MADQPENGMFSIKLVKPGHLKYRYFVPRLDAADDSTRLMNFHDRPRTLALATSIRPGHRALVYVTSPVMKFVWAIEYSGTVEDGQRVAKDQWQLDVSSSHEWRIFIPIRFLATIDIKDSPQARDVVEQAGVDFTPRQTSMIPISASDYVKIVDAISWQWVAHTQQIADSTIPS